MFIVLACWPALTLGHEPSELAKQRMLEGGWFEYIWIGAEHMLTGWDHLLFLLGVMFFLRSLVDVLRFITAFTLGHSLTLVSGTLMGVQVNPYLIDAVIALTVVYKAFENLGGFQGLLGREPPPLLAMVFVFGLIHGLGLATRLQQLTLQADPTLWIKLVFFNVGVELGQVFALLAVAGALWAWRDNAHWPRFAAISNSLLLAGGLSLFALQIQALVSELTVN